MDFPFHLKLFLGSVVLAPVSILRSVALLAPRQASSGGRTGSPPGRGQHYFAHCSGVMQPICEAFKKRFCILMVQLMAGYQTSALSALGTEMPGLLNIEKLFIAMGICDNNLTICILRKQQVIFFKNSCVHFWGGRMFVWLKMHKNASPVLEICFVAFILFYFFLEREHFKNQTCLWREFKTNKPFEKSSFLLTVLEDVSNV